MAVLEPDTARFVVSAWPTYKVAYADRAAECLFSDLVADGWPVDDAVAAVTALLAAAPGR